MVKGEWVLKVKYREEQRHKLAQRHHQRHRQRRHLCRQNKHRLYAHISEIKVKEIMLNIEKLKSSLFNRSTRSYVGNNVNTCPDVLTEFGNIKDTV